MTERIVLPIHGADHCPGGPDPIPCFTSLPYAYMGDFTGRTVASGAWTAFTDWTEGFANQAALDLSDSMEPQLAGGTIDLGPPGLYWATAHALWADAWAAGNKLGVRLQWNGAGIVLTPGITSSTVVTDGTINIDADYISVASSAIGTSAANSVSAQVYHDQGTTQFLDQLIVMVFRVAAYDATDGQSYP